MKEKIKHILKKIHPKHVNQVLLTFLRDETISGKLILAAAVLSMIIVNSPLLDSYQDLWHTDISLGIGRWSLAMDLRHWINEGLMAFFFLTVGLEIKREIVRGELREFKVAILPIAAALGGMVIPALIYLSFNPHGTASQGWGIPIATDIAFAIAILSLLGRRVPVALKVFLLTLAIADDIGAITVIALFYAEIIHYGWLGLACVTSVLLFICRKQLTDRLVLVIVAGIFLWIATHLSGLHASIVGAIMGLIAPVSPAKYRLSVAERVEKFFIPITTFVVLPLFAFANAGFVITRGSLENNSQVMWGIVLGLVFGKMIGILLATWLLVKTRLAKLPEELEWRHVWGVSLLAGIGFTVSIFITELAFAGNSQLIDTAKLSIFIASGASALFGSAVLLGSKKLS